MGETTAIQWTDHTFNPWIGCTKVHAGCTNCYAEKLGTTRLGVKWGDKAERRVTSASNWRLPGRWARAAAKAGVRRRVFCASLADVLDERAPAEAQARLWQLIRETTHLCSRESDRLRPCRDFGTAVDDGDRRCAACGAPCGGLDWQLLTKRPERWEIVPEDVRPLVWLGTSIADQRTADEFLPRLLAARGFAKRFVSAEPLVGPVKIGCLRTDLGHRRIDWVIVGGESGPGARACYVSWIDSIVEQCSAARVPCFVKQLGAHHMPNDIGVTDKKGGDWMEWPMTLRVREFPVDVSGPCVECGEVGP